jgi:protein SCO1
MSRKDCSCLECRRNPARAGAAPLWVFARRASGPKRCRRFALPPKSIWALLGLVIFLGCSPAPAPQNEVAATTSTNRQVFQVKGVVQEVKLEERRAVIRHEAIPNYMPAMTMPLEVKNTNELAGLAPGDEITFSMIVTEDDGWIENIKKVGTTNAPVAPARQSTRLVRDVEPLGVGDKIPNYTFTNSLGERVSFGDFPGQAIAFTFIFTRCPFPTFCPRMNSNFADAFKLLQNDSNAPTNWHLFTISFDPDYDTPARLKAYSKSFNPDPKKWDWVTGAMIDIDAITEQVGLVFSFENSTINHNLRTVVVDRNGVIRQILKGNEWTGRQLADEIIAGAKGESVSAN